MVGQARGLNREREIDPHYLSSINNSSTGNQATNVTSSIDRTKQYLKTKNGIFNGTFGSVAQTLDIDIANILDLTGNSTGKVVVRRVVHVNPWSGTTGTLGGIELDGNELPYQELIVIGVAGDTLTITHNSGSVTGTQRPILCPGNTNATLTGDESLYFIFDNTLDSWILTGVTGASGADNLGDHLATQNLDMGGFDIINIDDIKMSTNDKYFYDGGSDTYMTGSSTSGRINVFNNASNITSFLTSGLLTTNITCANITTTGNIDIDGHVLILDSDGDTNINSTSDDNINFKTGGGVRALINNSGLSMFSNILMNNKDIDLDSNMLILDTDGDTSISAAVNDTILFTTNSNGRMSVTNSGLLMASNITLLDSFSNIILQSGFDNNKIFFDGGGNTYLTGNSTSGSISVVNDGTVKTAFTNSGITTSGLTLIGDIEIAGNDLDFTTGGTVDFHDITSSVSGGGASALPSQPVAYFKVKYQGATRYIPYYS